MSTIVDEILDCVEENPRAVVGYILNKRIHLLDIAPTIRDAVKEKKVDVKKVRNAVKEREL